MSSPQFGKRRLIRNDRETRNRAYVELDEMFEAKVPARKFAGYISNVDRTREEHARSMNQATLQ